jgi:hypothetical protein
MTNSKTGKCRLCLTEGVELQNSHFLPAAIYKVLRDEGSRNSNPWKLSAEGAVQTSKQMQEYLLCFKCEQHFREKGEDWVLRHCLLNSGQFRIKKILCARTDDIVNVRDASGTRGYYASNIPEIDMEALTYFAASIFWHGSIHTWNEDGSVSVRFGPYQEQFRKYLRGEAPFPRYCFLWVCVRDGDEIDRLTYAPIGQKKQMYWMYKFPMPGLAFSLFVGKSVPAGYRSYCFVNGAFNPIFVTPNIEKFRNSQAQCESKGPQEGALPLVSADFG